jgi:hypothetical protein
MTTQDLLTTLEEGLENGRISPHLAAYIAAELLHVDARDTGYDERVRLDEALYEKLPASRTLQA